MKKWFDEEYEFEVEVIGYLRGDKPRDTAVTEKKSGISTAAPTAAL